MKKRLFAFQLEERNGEQEYNHEHLVWAKDITEAERLAHHFAKTFYNDEEGEMVGDYYTFFSGGIALRLRSLQETTKNRWQERRYRESVI